MSNCKHGVKLFFFLVQSGLYLPFSQLKDIELFPVLVAISKVIINVQV